jgi:hypothetical protein
MSLNAYRIGNSCGLQFTFGIKHVWDPESVCEDFGCLVELIVHADILCLLGANMW